MRKPYKLNGVEMPHVTDILRDVSGSEGLIRWAYNCGCNGLNYQTERQNAADRGIELHKILDLHIKARRGVRKRYPSLRHYDEKTKLLYTKFCVWEESSEVKWIASEKTVYAKDECFAGTLDGLCYIKGVKTLMDWKRTNTITDTVRLQLAAYKFIYDKYYRTEDEAPITQRLVGWFKDDEFKIRKFRSEYGRDKKAFFAALDFYYFSKKRKLKNNWRAK
jgi:hypothetical protein